MNKIFHSQARLFFILTVLFSTFTFVRAQTDEPPPPPPPKGYTVGSDYYKKSDEDEKGATVRGRVFYQDTNNPVRRGWVGLTKIRELIEKVENSEGREGIAVKVANYGGEKYTLTNDNGEFTIRNVKPGIYQPVFKVAGILNPNSVNSETPLYSSITVDGFGEIDVQVAAKRGGSVSGRVQYFDGAPVIGAKVQIVSKKDSERLVRYGSDDNTSDTTDDRGFYHFAGLPDGEYFVRVTEPSIHNEAGNSVQSYNISSYGSSSMLTTFYPGAAKTDDATAINVVAGQEQSEINISIPDRRLFKISGTVVAKNNQTPVKNLQISFQKVGEQSYSYYYDQSKQAKTDEQGKWSFGDLPKGKYLIKVSNNEQYVYAPDGKPKIENQTKYATINKEIEIDNENVTDVILEMITESAISGTVIVEGGKEFPPFVFLRAFDEKNKAEASSSINNYGERDKTPTNKTAKTFRISSLSAGNYTFLVNTNENFYVKSARSGNVDLMNSPIEIGEGVEIKDVQVVLSTDVGSLKGKISNFTATERAFVFLLPVNKSGMNMLFGAGRGNVGKTGEFEAKAAPGEYYAVAVGESSRPKSENLDDVLEWLKKLTADAPKVTIKAGETANATLDLPKK